MHKCPKCHSVKDINYSRNIGDFVAKVLNGQIKQTFKTKIKNTFMVVKYCNKWYIFENGRNNKNNKLIEFFAYESINYSIVNHKINNYRIF